MSRPVHLRAPLLLAAALAASAPFAGPARAATIFVNTELGANSGVDPTIFADGFEAGHTLLWTSEVL